MKWLSYILSVYLLGLFFISCADGIAMDNASQETVVTADSHAGHDHGSAGHDLCSPMCSCHCCHVHVVFPEMADEAPLPTAVAIPTAYRNQFESIDLFDLFIPPRS